LELIMQETTLTPRKSAYTAFWLYRARDQRPTWSSEERENACRSIHDVITRDSPGVELRGAYVTTGLTAGVELILWLVADDAAAFQKLGVAIRRSPLDESMTMEKIYLGVASASQYDPNHGPAFLRGVPPKQYLSVYPFTKTPNWYLLPFEKRRELMIEHGKMGQEFPTILTNTVNSFGIADQEFIVALEDDDPTTLVKMVQRLRAAAVREYTQVDTPIFLGLRQDLGRALDETI
jgi:chlorite dismutase